MMIPPTDPRIAQVPVHESHEPLVMLGASFGHDRAWVRSSVAARLRRAQLALPPGTSLRVIEGYHTDHPSHATGAAVDVMLVDLHGIELRSADATLGALLGEVGLVSEPGQPWHWSYGDSYWAVVTGTGVARYGPLTDIQGPAVPARGAA